MEHADTVVAVEDESVTPIIRINGSIIHGTACVKLVTHHGVPLSIAV